MRSEVRDLDVGAVNVVGKQTQALALRSWPFAVVNPVLTPELISPASSDGQLLTTQGAVISNIQL